MIKKLKSLTQRAAQAIKNDTPSAELTEIKREVGERIHQVEVELKTKEQEIEAAMIDGDLDGLRAIRHQEAELKDEDKVLHRQNSDLHRAIRNAEGEEAMKSAEKLRKELGKALDQAEKAQAILQQAQASAREVAKARETAAYIGESLLFDSATIRSLAELAFKHDTEQKQIMIDLGIRDAMIAERG
ncbi:hypothetical protein H2508_04590 [Parahaliea sp. F7430]|uniref:PspA/IM30 family protein n=1 Tax=Sediminihaliea albiluteola TaxID=2758564 RepID=A0A7W2YJ92_9GAMM|nr:hypothetical protein [Sediminihaliea albiluteola]MBA6412384.1 hypothetical protein [Sediminihaliea albiluteola]